MEERPSLSWGERKGTRSPPYPGALGKSQKSLGLSRPADTSRIPLPCRKKPLGKRSLSPSQAAERNERIRPVESQTSRGRCAGLLLAFPKWEGAQDAGGLGRKRTGRRHIGSPSSKPWVSNGDIWQYLGTFWAVMTGGGMRVLLAPGRWRDAAQHPTMHRMPPPPPQKSRRPNVGSAKGRDPAPRRRSEGPAGLRGSPQTSPTANSKTIPPESPLTGRLGGMGERRDRRPFWRP